MTEMERAMFMQFIDAQYDLLIRKIVMGILEDESLVDDVKQNVMIKLARKAERLQTLPPKALTDYVGTAVRNEAITIYRKRSIDRCKEARYMEQNKGRLTMDYVGPKAFEGKYGFSEEMWELLMKLPQLDREIMIYRYYHGLTSREIAEIIGTNREMVKKRFQRIRDKLAKMIKERGVEFK